MTTTTTTTTTNPFDPARAMLIWGAPGQASYIGRPRVWEYIYTANHFTTPSYFRRSADNDIGEFLISVSIRGSFTGTVTLQRSFDNGATWHDFDSWTAPVETVFSNPDHDQMWRLGVKTGDLSAGGPIFCMLSQ